MTIIRTGNLTRAAEQLNISQSALSSQIKHLEESYGFPLFLRNSRGMQLNDNGREMLPSIEALLESEEKMRHKALTLRHGGGLALQVGLNADPGFLRVGAINRRLQKFYSEMNIIFLVSQTTRTAQLLRQGHLDLTYLYGVTTDPDILCQKMTDVRFCVVIPVALDAQGQSLSWSEVAALPWIWVEKGSLPYDVSLQEFNRRQLSPNQVVQAVDEHIVKELIMDGQGVAIMREDEARPLVNSGQVSIWKKGWLTLPLSLAWMARNDNKYQIRTAREVIAYLWQTASQTEISGVEYNY